MTDIESAAETLTWRADEQKEGLETTNGSLARSTHPHDMATRQAMVINFNTALASFCSEHPAQLKFVDINRHVSRDGQSVSLQFTDVCDPTNIQ